MKDEMVSEGLYILLKKEAAVTLSDQIDSGRCRIEK